MTLHRALIIASSCVSLAFVAGCSKPAEPVAATSSKPTADETAMFRKLEVDMWAAWSKNLKAVDAAPFYSKKPGTLHFDISPLKFTGWDEYVVESQKALPKEGGTAKVVIDDDFTVLKGGPNLAVVAFTWKTTFFTPDGKQRGIEIPGRETDVWEKEEDGQWRMTHQHLSVVPGAMGPPPAAKK